MGKFPWKSKQKKLKNIILVLLLPTFAGSGKYPFAFIRMIPVLNQTLDVIKWQEVLPWMDADCTLQLKYPLILKARHFLFPLGHAQFRCTVPILCACHPQLVEVPNGHCWFCSATAQITYTRPLLTLPQARTCIYKPCCVLYFHTHQGNTSRFFPNENILQKPCLVHLQPCHRVSTHTCCALCCDAPLQQKETSQFNTQQAHRFSWDKSWALGHSQTCHGSLVQFNSRATRCQLSRCNVLVQVLAAECLAWNLPQVG